MSNRSATPRSRLSVSSGRPTGCSPDGADVAAVCREPQISEQTYYRWRNQYGGLKARLRDECLNINSFNSLLHARVVISDWKTEYNHDRRHSTLGYLAPADYARTCTHQLETGDKHSKLTQRRGQAS